MKSNIDIDTCKEQPACYNGPTINDDWLPKQPVITVA